ncbi:MAG: molybdate ABC transporter substrate-binding protein [Deltaproteobacteria bacterium]|nr:molybdate ABC transporter substrate-binding protein [Deltaproteobacteria bacterium]
MGTFLRTAVKAALAVCLVFVTLFFTCRSSPAAGTLTVAGAADLTFAFKEIAAEFEKETGLKVILSMGSTGMLTRQIEQGAPFDVFFAANSKYIDELNRGNYVMPDTVELYAVGRIVLAVNRSSGIRATELADLLDPRIKRVAIANPDHAPYGVAAMEAMKSAGLWERLKGKLVYGENVRATLQFIQTGNAEAGIVALSVADLPEISYTVIDSKQHNPIKQSAAVVRGTREEKAARDFIKFVNGPKGRPIMKKYGFALPE